MSDDLIQQLSEAGHHEEAASLASKLDSQLTPEQQQAADQRDRDQTPNGRMNQIIRAGGSRGTGNVNADLRAAAGREVTS